MSKTKVRFYESFTDDFEVTANQGYALRSDYKWVRDDVFSKILSAVVYALAVVFSTLYCRLFLHMRVKGRENLKGIKGGFFIYGNHTQPIGDVFIPALCVLPKRIYTVVSTANYGIPLIGKILPYLGALPVTDTLHGIRELNVGVSKRIAQGHPIVIYPEAHVWEYYTGIRPFPDTSFTFPARLDKAVFSMTVTYKKSRLFKRPRMDVYIDGPFFAEGTAVKEKAESLHKKVYSVMQERCKLSNAEYIKYRSKADL